MPIAQLRYEGDGEWTLYFGDRNGKWTMYFDLDTKQPVDVLINELGDDPTCVFWGWVRSTRHARSPYHRSAEDHFSTTRRDVIARSIRTEKCDPRPANWTAGSPIRSAEPLEGGMWHLER